MLLYYPEYKIAVGPNNPGGLQSIESITPSGDRAFIFPQQYFNNNPGLFRRRLNDRIYIAGKFTSGWNFFFLTKAQYTYLSDTYCGGLYDGEVTIRGRFREHDTFRNANAVMELPKLAEVQNRLGRLGGNLLIPFFNTRII